MGRGFAQAGRRWLGVEHVCKAWMSRAYVYQRGVNGPFGVYSGAPVLEL